MKSLRIEGLKSLSLAALLMAAATFTACSSEDGLAEEPVQQPENPAKKTYTMTVTATKGGDNALARAMAGVTDPTPSPSPTWEGSSADDGAAAPLPSRGGAGVGSVTRALSYDDGTKTLDATWAEGETVTVYKGSEELGTLTAQTDGSARTTLSGTLEGTVAADDVLTLKYQRALIDDQDGTLTGGATSIDRTCDYAVATVTVASAEGGVITIVGGEAAFQNQLAIVRFKLEDVDGNEISASTLLVKLGGKDIIVKPTDDEGLSEFYVAVPPISDKDVKLYAVEYEGLLYYYTKTGVTFEAGQFYAITVKMIEGDTKSFQNNAHETLEDGDILCGSIIGENNIKIADGATVMLLGAQITSNDGAGITCLGDATIVVADDGDNENVITSEKKGYPGIQVAAGHTLTILGSGTLTATGAEGGAGIGAAKSQAAGNIIIAGGTITATGGSNAAGIGSGYGDPSASSCGNILIKGGTVTAYGGSYAAGIGSGYNSACSDITITTGVTSVTATAGNGAKNSIGTGNRFVFYGTITIGCTLDEDGNPVGGLGYPDIVGGYGTGTYTYPSETE